MKDLLLFFFILLATIGCRSSKASIQSLEYTLPVRVEDDWKKAIKKLGTPDRSGDNFFSFYRYGIIVYTDASLQKVTSVIATRFENGQRFTGKLYGIGLGDTLPKCRRLWGKEQSKEFKTDNYYIMVWKLGKRTLELEFWLQDGNDADLGGIYEADTVKRIQIT